MSASAGHAHREGTRWRGQPIDRSFNIGTLSGLTLVRAAAVTPFPSEISFASACIVGCGVMTGVGSAMTVAKIEKGDSVVVIGCGGVGLNVIQGARLAGASRIIAVDVHQDALQRARSFGATHVIFAMREDRELQLVADEVRPLTAGRGADHAFESTSIPHLAFTPLRLVRDGGAAYQVSGINDPVTANMQWFMWSKTYVTPLYGQCVPGRDFPRLFEYYRQGKLLLDELVTRTYRLDQLKNAIDDMLSGRNAKGVILFDE